MPDKNEQAKPSLPQNTKPAAESPATSTPFSLLKIASWFLGSLLLISIAGGYYLWNFVNDTKDNIEQKIVSNNVAASTLSRSLSNTESKLDNKIAALKTLQSELSDSVAALLAKSTHMRKDWLVSEAEYLVKLAINKLILEDDVKTAITALNNADARLLEAGDPGLLLLRQEISNKLTALKALPVIDTSGMSIQISSVIQQVENLPLVTPDPKSFKQIQQSTDKDDVPTNWKEVTSRVISDVTSLIRIRKHDQIVQPLLSPEQRFFLVQNLKLQLEQARTALLHQQQIIYRERLSQAIVWINEYFDISKAATKASLNILNNLNKKTLTNPIPDLTIALRMFDKFQDGTQLQKNVTPPKPKKNISKKIRKKIKPKKITAIKKQNPKPVINRPEIKKPDTKKVEPVINKNEKNNDSKKTKTQNIIEEKTSNEKTLENNTKKVPLIIPTKPGLAL